jgi:hypothetical protein
MNGPLMTEVKVPAIEWRVPDQLSIELPPKPYPSKSLPRIMRNAVLATARLVAAPVALAAQCFIAAAAYLAQTRVNAPHLHNPEGIPCSLFQLALADSGDRKSECYRLAFKPIEEAERTNRDEYATTMVQYRNMQAGKSGKALQEFKEQVALPPNPRTLYADATYERIAGDFVNGMSSAMWTTDEGGRILGGPSMKSDTVAAILGGLVKLFDSGRVERDRVGEFGNGIAYDRRFSIHMLAQEITVRSALNDPLLQGQGFLPRFLMTSAPSLAGTRYLTIKTMKASAYRDPAVQLYWERCEEIARMESFADPDGAVKPPVIELTQEAELVWMAFYNRIEAEQGSLGEYGGPLKPFASRSGELVRRVAAVFALFEGELEISEQTMIAACEIVEHSLQEWSRYLGQNAAESNGNREALELLEWLKMQPTVRTVKGITKVGPRKFRPVARARGALLTLITAGWVVFPKGDNQAFEINPHQHADEVANLANPAKTSVNADVVVGEFMANDGESAAEQDHSVNVPGEIRHHSPLVRQDSAQQVQAHSPDSPDSPPASAEGTSGWSMTV